MNMASPFATATIDDDVRSPTSDELNALIREAQERARRRRRRRWTGVVAAAVVAAGTLVGFSSIGGSPPSEAMPDVTSGVPGEPTAGADSQGSSSTIVAEWGEFRVGWVLVYGDGRVIAHFDDGLTVSGTYGYGPFERHLTPQGLQLVLEGDIPVATLIKSMPLYDVGDVWADPRIAHYVPSTYAICPSLIEPTPYDVAHADRSVLLSQAPVAAQQLLLGNERTFAGDGSLPTWDCWEVTPSTARALVDVLRDPNYDGFFATDPVLGRPEVTGFKTAQGSIVMLPLTPVLPHGNFVRWGG